MWRAPARGRIAHRRRALGLEAGDQRRRHAAFTCTHRRTDWDKRAQATPCASPMPTSLFRISWARSTEGRLSSGSPMPMNTMLDTRCTQDGACRQRGRGAERQLGGSERRLSRLPHAQQHCAGSRAPRGQNRGAGCTPVPDKPVSGQPTNRMCKSPSHPPTAPARQVRAALTHTALVNDPARPRPAAAHATGQA